LVNGQPLRLPALRANCSVNDPDTGKLVDSRDFYVLDQPSYPIILVEDEVPVSLRKVQVVKITFPDTEPPRASPASGAAPSSMERALADNQPVQVYGIYFDFNSADIRP